MVGTWWIVIIYFAQCACSDRKDPHNSDIFTYSDFICDNQTFVAALHHGLNNILLVSTYQSTSITQ